MLEREGERALACLRAIAATAPEDCPMPDMANALASPNFRTLRELAADIGAFLEFQDRREAEGCLFEYADRSLGNLVFSGRWLRTGRDFNAACGELGTLCSCRAEVVNVTRGENLVLTALKADGTYLARKSDIVSAQHTPAPIAELFLLPACLRDGQVAQLDTQRSLWRGNCGFSPPWLSSRRSIRSWKNAWPGQI